MNLDIFSWPYSQRSLLSPPCLWLAGLTLWVGLSNFAGAQSPPNSPASSQPAASQPATSPLVFEAETLDIGSIYHGSQREIVFRAVNRSKQPFQIANVRSTCSCSSAKYDQVVPAGAETEVRVTFRSRRLDLGRFTKELIFIPASMAESPRKLIFEGELVPTLQPDPLPIRLRGLYSEESSLVVTLAAPPELQVRPASDAPFAKALHGYFEVGPLETVEAGQLYRLTLRKPAVVRPRSWADELHFEVECSDGQRRSIGFRVRVDHDNYLVTDPAKSLLFTQRLEEGEEASAWVDVHATDLGDATRSFQIRRVAIEFNREEAFAADYETVTPGKHYRVRVRQTKAPSSPRAGRARLLIETDLPEQPTIRLLIAARPAPRPR